jgi:hypothetical protein
VARKRVKPAPPQTPTTTVGAVVDEKRGGCIVRLPRMNGVYRLAGHIANGVLARRVVEVNGDFHDATPPTILDLDEPVSEVLRDQGWYLARGRGSEETDPLKGRG